MITFKVTVYHQHNYFKKLVERDHPRQKFGIQTHDFPFESQLVPDVSGMFSLNKFHNSFTYLSCALKLYLF